MFKVTVTYEQEYFDEEIHKVQELYYQTRDYGYVNSYFGDFGLCDCLPECVKEMARGKCQ